MKGKIITDEHGKQYREIRIPNAYPIWAAAAVWITAALFIPMRGFTDILIIAAISVLAALIVGKCTVKEIRRIELPFSSGNAEFDTLIREMDASLEKIRLSREAIIGSHPEAAERISGIESSVSGIRECLIKDPKDAKGMRRFLEYYLPTTVKLTEKYSDETMQKAGTANTEETLSAIEKVLAQIDESFKKQYDALFADDRLDITSDITVLETMLRRDELVDEKPFEITNTEETKHE